MVKKRMPEHSYKIDVTFSVSGVSAKNLIEAKQKGSHAAIKWGRIKGIKAKREHEVRR